jgi:endogenous inhibitor of DNA gyrase (YacG/DUF329 family)
MPLPNDPEKASAARKKMREAAIKRMADPETRDKIRAANIGKKQSKETIAKRVKNLKEMKRPPVSEKSREKYRESVKKLWEDPDYRKRMSESHTGKKQSKETIEKRVEKIKGIPRSARIQKTCTYCGKEFLLADWEKDRKFCSMECKGKWQSENAVHEKSSHWSGGNIVKKCQECGKEFAIEKYRQKTARFCSPRCTGIWLAKHDLIKFPPRLFGPDHPAWTGGPKDYCEKWTRDFRERIRAFFGYQCSECGSPQGEELLHCHHVYYDKKACCSINEDGKYVSNLGVKGNPFTFEIEGDPNKFVALCRRCHSLTTAKKNREKWARHFEQIINEYYLGRSYFTKEEYEGIK